MAIRDWASLFFIDVVILVVVMLAVSFLWPELPIKPMFDIVLPGSANE